MGNKSTYNIKYVKSINIDEKGVQTPSLAQATTWYVRSGSNDPAWRYKVKRGIKATGGLSIDIRDASWRGATIKRRVRDSVNSPWREYQCVNPVTTVVFNTGTSSVLQKATNACLMRFYKKLRASQRELSGPTFVAELHSTLRMLKRPAASIRDFTIAWSNRARKRTKTLKGHALNKVVSDLYLEYQFGVKPLLEDTADAARAIGKVVEQPRITRVTAFETDSEVVCGQQNVGAYVFSNITAFTDVEFIAGVSARAGLRAQAQFTGQSALERLKDAAGFNWSEVVPAAWEAIPASFIVDYFSNVGEVLSAMTTDTSMVTWFSLGSKYERKVTRLAVLEPINTLLVQQDRQDAGGWFTSNVTVSRSGNLTVPSLQLQIPGLKQGLNLTALWNSLRKR